MEERRRGEATMVCLTELNNGVKKSKLFPAVAEKFQLKIETVRKDVRRAIDVLMGFGVEFHKRSWCVMGNLDMELVGDVVQAQFNSISEAKQRFRYFSNPEEGLIVAVVVLMKNMAIGMKKDDVMRFARFLLYRKMEKDPAFKALVESKNQQVIQLISEKWYRSFMARHKEEISAYKSSRLDKKRLLAADSWKVNLFYDRVEEFIDFLVREGIQPAGVELLPIQVYCADELWANQIKENKVVGGTGRTTLNPQYSGHSHTAAEGERPYYHATVMACGRADGQSGCPLMVVYPAKKGGGEPVEYSENLKHGIAVEVTENGSMDEDTFLKWVKHFLKHLPTEDLQYTATPPSGDQEQKTLPVLLFMDAHGSHYSLEAWLELLVAGVYLIFTNAHFTHFGSAQDNGYNSLLETLIRNEKNECPLPLDMFTLPIHMFNKILSDAYGKFISDKKHVPGVIKRSFEKTGLFPVDRNQILQNPHFKAQDRLRQVHKRRAASMFPSSKSTCPLKEGEEAPIMEMYRLGSEEQANTMAKQLGTKIIDVDVYQPGQEAGEAQQLARKALCAFADTIAMKASAPSYPSIYKMEQKRMKAEELGGKGESTFEDEEEEEEMGEESGSCKLPAKYC